MQWKSNQWPTAAVYKLWQHGFHYSNRTGAFLPLIFQHLLQLTLPPHTCHATPRSLLGSPAYMVLAASLAQQHQRHATWRTSRLRLMAWLNTLRCRAAAPLYGADLLRAVANMAHPDSKALNPDLIQVVDHTWTPFAADEAQAGAVAAGSGAGVGAGAGAVAAAPTGAGSALVSVGSAGAPQPQQPGQPQLPGNYGFRRRNSSNAQPGSPSGKGRGSGKPSGGPWGPSTNHFALQQRSRKASSYSPGARRLHMPSLVLDVSATYAQRAEALEVVLKEFMFVVPKVGRPGWFKNGAMVWQIILISTQLHFCHTILMAITYFAAHTPGTHTVNMYPCVNCGLVLLCSASASYTS